MLIRFTDEKGRLMGLDHHAIMEVYKEHPPGKPRQIDTVIKCYDQTSVIVQESVEEVLEAHLMAEQLASGHFEYEVVEEE